MISWPYLDFGIVGLNKELEGFDLVCTGEVSVTIGYDQTNFAIQTPAYVVNGDTLPDVGIVPFPLSAPSLQFNLTFSAGQAWEWETLNVYLTQGPST